MKESKVITIALTPAQRAKLEPIFEAAEDCVGNDYMIIGQVFEDGMRVALVSGERARRLVDDPSETRNSAWHK